MGMSSGVLKMLLLAFLVIEVGYMALSWAVFEPNIGIDQRTVAAASAVLLFAIVLGVPVLCVCSKGRVRIG